MSHGGKKEEKTGFFLAPSDTEEEGEAGGTRQRLDRNALVRVERGGWRILKREEINLARVGCQK